MHNVQSKLFVLPLEHLEYSNGVKHTNGVHRRNGFHYSNGVHFGNGVQNGDSHADGTRKPTINQSADEVPLIGTQDEWIGLPEAQQIDLPVGTSIKRISCRRDDSRIFIHCVGYTVAGRIYKYKFHSHANGVHSRTLDVRKDFGKLSIWRESVVDGFDPDQWTVEQVMVRIPDENVRIPMYILRSKFHAKSGDSFCLLYG